MSGRYGYKSLWDCPACDLSMLAPPNRELTEAEEFVLEGLVEIHEQREHGIK